MHLQIHIPCAWIARHTCDDLSCLSQAERNAFLVRVPQTSEFDYTVKEKDVIVQPKPDQNGQEQQGRNPTKSPGCTKTPQIRPIQRAVFLQEHANTHGEGVFPNQNVYVSAIESIWNRLFAPSSLIRLSNNSTVVRQARLEYTTLKLLILNSPQKDMRWLSII